MFTPKSPILRSLAKKHPKVIQELQTLLKGNVFMYIDYANVRPWAEKLRWHLDLKRLKQFLDAFTNIQAVKFYSGTLAGDEKSEKEVGELQNLGYHLRTKPVKLMKLSIDARGISSLQDPALLQQFISGSLLRKFTVETVEYLNRRFLELNQLGETEIEDRKCNFDVEIGVDMLLDAEREKIETFVLWSGDSDFHDPVQKLLRDGKKVILFATARRVSRELSELRKEGLLIFDIKKIQDFVCWNRERQRGKRLKQKSSSGKNSKR